MTSRIALLGLLADAILPGETHTLPAAALDPTSLAQLRKHKSAKVLSLPLATSAEMPSFVTGRVGVICDVVAIGKLDITLAGTERARITRVFVGPPVTAEQEVLVDEKSPALALSGAARLLEMRAADASPDGWATARAVLRGLAPQSALRAAMQSSLDVALQSACGDLQSSTAAAQVTRELDALAARKGTLTDADKREIAERIHALSRELELLPRLEGGDAMHGDIVSIERRLDAAALPPEALDLARRQCGALRSMQKAHYDYATLVAHLELMASLPWSGPLSVPPPFEALERALETQHFGLERVKRRLLEYLAVRALGGHSKGMVLCLSGPPGVGKTSLARSIADGLGRKLIRVPLGGVHDESEIRGHRRSFTNAGPGRILRGMRNAPRDPVMMLDEIDKLGTDTTRSPAAALLEVLDPEQNHAFADNFLGCPFDLGSVLFIATANDPGAILPALRDRLELIELEGYLPQEKRVIAERHVLPRVQRDVGLPEPLPIDTTLLDALVTGWTREAGVRELQRLLSSLARSRAVRHLRGEQDALATPITLEEITERLGPPRHRDRPHPAALPPGRVLGLSVGADGGAILPIEVLALPGKGELKLTGRQGEVMREAAEAARSCVRARASALGIEPSVLRDHDLHVHLPDGAIKKDGPSAGVATFLAIVSALTQRPVRGDIAITGELTLLGEILAVGGIRAKTLAAERAGLCRVLLPEANRADVPREVTIDRSFLTTLDEAIALALAP